MNAESRSPEFAKTRTFSSFAIENKEAMKLLREFGLLSQSHEERGKKAWGTTPEHNRSFRNISEHALVVGMTSDIIFEQLEVKGYLTNEERARGTKAAILHDLTKREEIEAGEHPDRKDAGYITAEEVRALKKGFFEKHGLSENDIEDYDLAHRTTFDTLEVDPTAIDLSASSDALREWTIFYSDFSVRHTEIVGPDDRIAEVKERGTYAPTYTSKHREMFGQEATEGLPNPNDATNEMLAISRAQLAKIESQLKTMLELPEDTDLHTFILEQLQRRYAEHQDT